MSVCKEIETVGESSESWERAAAAAVKSAVESLADRCIVRQVSDNVLSTPSFESEIIKLELVLNPRGTVRKYRARVKVSLVYAFESSAPFSRTRFLQRFVSRGAR